ncbi:signal recognition particle-docking protein FtsY [Arcanobacterium phocisimile]|uniref:Signal recognition particle receptor FtsY n=1 Tax=Arcanobacterium phocisimile TaxID=1302235 RepID=A0ABX7IHW4_9ACTO|nr:signal recognition particle-docking protein FtsY [Arcanobacterium phocisimile]QRV02677.1 signal recognition particle-docking protein FtsY [Arcanobacterium phocisimile]
MNTFTLLLIVGPLLALLIVGGAIAYVKTRNNKQLPPVHRESLPTGYGAEDSTPDGEWAEVGEEVSPELPAGGEAIAGHPGVDVPESVPSRMQRLRARLANSGGLGKALLGILSRGDLSPADWEELEDTLLMADVGLDATTEILENLRTAVKVAGPDADLRELLRSELLAAVSIDKDRSLNLTGKPSTILMVGVNGTGKTTTTGKLARLLVAEENTVLLGAADTFRAAAADQLGTWGERVGVEVVRSDREGADPASVAFEAVKQGSDNGVDVVIVDTAGRLQNKAGLMDELGKIKRVMEKTVPTSEVLLVLDATTGQNGMTQAKVFAEAAGITGIVLSKLDGTAKGGIVISVQRELGVPVKFVGLGEGADDFAPFDPENFVDSLLS